MEKVFLIILIAMGFLPAFGLLFLFFYKIYHNKQIKRFEQSGCMVLTRVKIGEILESIPPSQSLQIFKSAICDHSLINGVRYFTKYPFGSNMIVAHDNHRRALIAHAIGTILNNVPLLSEDLDICGDILLQLTDSHKEAAYTQLIAWDSLGKLSCIQKIKLIRRIEIVHSKENVSKNLIKGIGLIRFIFHLKESEVLDERILDFINDIILDVIKNGSYEVKALFIFKLIKSPYFDQAQKENLMKHFPENKYFANFLKNINNLYSGYTKDELCEGIKDFGLLPPPYSIKNTEGEIVHILLTEFIEEIYVPDSYRLQTFENRENRLIQSFDFLWFKP